MTRKTGVDDGTTATLADVTIRYTGERARVDTAYQRMLAITAVRHTPADARQAAADLAAAIRTATTTATEALRLVAPVAPLPPRRRLRRHRRASRGASTPVGAWSVELVRLSQIAVWLRRETLDDLGVHIPTVVRVSSLAALGPRIPGMGAEPAGPVGAATVDEPRIGVDLAAIIDRIEPVSESSPTTFAPEPSARAA